MSIAHDHIEPRRALRRPAAETVGHFLVALVFLSSFYVKFEPAICDLAFFAALLFFVRSGLSMTPVLAPLFLCLLIYNVAGLASYVMVSDDQYDSWKFVFTSFYMSLSAFFFAAYVAADPQSRFPFLMKYYIWGAVISSLLALGGYFHVLGALESFSVQGRLISGFKDPNVFSTYIILPTVYLLQGLLLGKMRITVMRVAFLLILLIALFLAFSRGAWINFVMAAVLMIGLSLFNSPDQKQRMGVVLKAVAVVGVMAVLLAALLSIEETRYLFLDRFTLVKEYDAGELGRFGNQRNSIPMLLLRPFGFGPLQFARYFPEAPHNTFLNAFSSFGWIGGITFFTMVVLNFYVGLRTALARTPYQPAAIAVFSCLVAVTLQGIQIDTEHWRHLYWMIGFLWGFHAANQSHGNAGYRSAETLEGWTVKASSRRFLHRTTGQQK
jgi:O-Antigen ligase